MKMPALSCASGLYSAAKRLKSSSASYLPDYDGLKLRLRALAKYLPGPEWSTLTRSRRVDVVVGLTLHCLLISLHVVLLFLARVSRIALLTVYTALLKTATMFGFVRPLRLLKDTTEVRQQLESATVLRIAGYNLVLFEGVLSSQKILEMMRAFGVCERVVLERLFPHPRRLSQPSPLTCSTSVFFLTL